MTVAIVAICRNEADIADLWIRHHLAEEISHIYVADASTDGTKEIFRSFDEVTVLDDTNEFCLQAEWTNRLAAMAGDAGHEWICPADVDEFFYAVSGRTITEELSDCPHDVLCARSYQHLDWNTRLIAPQRLPKVVFRWSPERQLTMGNHSVVGPACVYDVLDLRELKYRGPNHFIRKTRERNATLEPGARARGEAAHHQYLANKSDEELRVEWEAMKQTPIVCDQIPSRHSTGSHPHGMDQ